MRSMSSAWLALLFYSAVVMLAVLHCPGCSAQPEPAAMEKDGQQALDDLGIATAIIMEQEFNQGKSGVDAEAMLHLLRNNGAASGSKQSADKQELVETTRQRRRLGMKIKSFFEEQIYPDFRMVGRQMRRDANLVLSLLPPKLTFKVSSIVAPHSQEIRRKALRIWRGFSEVSIVPLLHMLSEILGFAAETVEDVADCLLHLGNCPASISISPSAMGDATTNSATQEDNIANTSEQESLLENVQHELQPSPAASATSSESVGGTQADLIQEEEEVEEVVVEL